MKYHRSTLAIDNSLRLEHAITRENQERGNGELSHLAISGQCSLTLCLLHLYSACRIYDGMLCDVFIQKASMAWHNVPHSRIMVSLCSQVSHQVEAENRLYLARDNRHMWPL